MNLPRELTSSKYRVCLGASVLAAIPLIFSLTDPGLSRPAKMEASENYVKYVLVLWGFGVGATGFEDAMNPKKKQDENEGESPTISPPAPPATKKPDRVVLPGDKS